MLASPHDLEVYLGVPSIDVERAMLMLEEAENLCSSIVTPVPDKAKGVVLAVAARAFTNPTGLTSETIGPVTVQRGTGTLYLSKADKATIRRLAGGSGAFSIDTLPTGTSAVQQVALIGAPTGGVWTLSFVGQTTGPIPPDASQAAVQAAIGALSVVGTGNVSVAGSGPYIVSFINDMATRPLPTMTADGSALTGGADPDVLVTVVKVGVFAPGQDLPWWDRTHGRDLRGWR